MTQHKICHCSDRPPLYVALSFLVNCHVAFVDIHMLTRWLVITKGSRVYLGKVRTESESPVVDITLARLENQARGRNTGSAF